MIDLRGRSFLSLKDFTPEEITYLLDYAAVLKKAKQNGKTFDLLKGKNIVLLFEKTSTRTRCAFEVAGSDEGAHVTFLSNSQMGKKESIKDTARVLGRFYDGIEFRGNKQATIDILDKESGVPVWNGLTDEFHPTQVLADMLTIREHFGDLDDKKFVFIGDARNNMGNSLMIGCAKLGLDFVSLAPKELFPDENLVRDMRKVAEENNSSITITDNKEEALKDADVIYTDIWVSMGEEDLIEERIDLLKDYQVNPELVALTGKDETIFLHCLPSFHNDETDFSFMVKENYGLDAMEVTDDVFYSDRSLVFDEAENRMHTIKAVMCTTLADDPNRIFIEEENE